MLERIERAWHHWDIKRRIRRHGWTAIYVGDYSTAPTWAYTIGFHDTLGAPEVIVFDITRNVANGLFQVLFEDLKSGKLVIADGELWRPEENEKPVIWRKVHRNRLYDNDAEQPWLGLAEDFARLSHPESGPITAFQLVLSDPDGRLPWESGYDERVRERQRALWKPSELAAESAV